MYYRCGNNHPDPDHPKIRWRETDLEQAILQEFETIRIPDPDSARWFRDAVEAAFADVTTTKALGRKMLNKRRTELSQMQDRLLNAYLAGTIDEQTFQIKSADLKAQGEDIERQLEEIEEFDPSMGKHALELFDFSQKLPELWHGSNSGQKRQILEAVSLNRALTDVSLVLTKRKPFDILAKRPFFRETRGRCPNSEPAELVQPYVAAFLHPPALPICCIYNMLRPVA